jgi:hypothetical protein
MILYEFSKRLQGSLREITIACVPPEGRLSTAFRGALGSAAQRLVAICRTTDFVFNIYVRVSQMEDFVGFSLSGDRERFLGLIFFCFVLFLLNLFCFILT